MDKQELLEKIQRFGGFRNAEEAERALCATLRALGTLLVDTEVKPLADELPAEFAQILRGAEYDPNSDRAELFARVAKHEGVDPGFAMEHASAVCTALSEEMSFDLLTRLRRHLPELNDLLAPSQRYPSRPHMKAVTDEHTLATGRPGSTRPLSEARPDQGHSESIARSDDPGARRKISSAH